MWEFLKIGMSSMGPAMVLILYYPEMSAHPDCPRLCWVVSVMSWRCLAVSGGVWRCSEVFRGVQRCSEVFRGVQRCCGMSRGPDCSGVVDSVPMTGQQLAKGASSFADGKSRVGAGIVDIRDHKLSSAQLCRFLAWEFGRSLEFQTLSEQRAGFGEPGGAGWIWKDPIVFPG